MNNPLLCKDVLYSFKLSGLFEAFVRDGEGNVLLTASCKDTTFRLPAHLFSNGEQILRAILGQLNVSPPFKQLNLETIAKFELIEVRIVDTCCAELAWKGRTMKLELENFRFKGSIPDFYGEIWWRLKLVRM